MLRLARAAGWSLVLCALLAPSALADPPDVAVTVSGTIERTHEDTADGAKAVTFLSTAAGPRAVAFAPDQPVPPNGAEVDLHGRVKGGTLEAASVEVTGPTIMVPTPAAARGTPLAAGGPRTVDMVVISFASPGLTPTYTDDDLRNVLVSSPSSVSNYFAEQSYGAVSFTGITNPAGDIYRVSIASNGTGCSSNAWQTWATQANAAVALQTSNHYDHTIYVFNSNGTCGWAGLGYMPGDTTFIDNAFSLRVVAHELGHNLGVHHAASLRCNVGGQNVSFTSAGYACVPNEYGDPFDIMGSSNTNQQNAFHKLQSGWLGSSTGSRVRTITASGDYTVVPLEAASGVALLMVPHVTTGAIAATNPSTELGDTFALDFRQPTGSYFDAYAAGSSAVGGVQIRLVQTPGGSPDQTQLIDANPLTSTFNDAALANGATFTDSTDGITIQTVDVNPLGATVRVTFGATGGAAGGGTNVVAPDTTPPTSVSSLSATIASGPVVSLAFGAASDDRAVSSYRITRDNGQIDLVGASQTTYADWTAAYGAHTYGVTAIDSSGNVGPTATISTLISPPVVPTIIPTTTPTATPVSGRPSTRLAKKVLVAVKVRLTRNGGKRKAVLSWARATGAHSYLVTRNGHKLRTTKVRRLVDATPPRGALRYVVTVAS